MRKLLVFFCILSLLAPTLSAPPAAAAPAEGGPLTSAPASPAAPSALDVSEELVPSDVASYALAAPKLFWYDNRVPLCPFGIPGTNETIQRLPASGGRPRVLYAAHRTCEQYLATSNIAADANYVYWLGPGGLMRLSVNANPGDPPETLNAALTGPGLVADGGDRLFTLSGNSSGASAAISVVLKATNATTLLVQPGGVIDTLQTDGHFVFYSAGAFLYRFEPGVDVGIGRTVSTAMTGYYVDPRITTYCTLPEGCDFTTVAFVAQGDKVYRYINSRTILGSPVYTALFNQTVVYDLVSDGSNRLFLFEKRQVNCAPLCEVAEYLVRTGKTSQTGKADIYSYGPSTAFDIPSHLSTDGERLFWVRSGSLRKLMSDSGALPSGNVFVTGMEITQGIQNTSNRVMLVRKRPTIVRVYVSAAGSAVPGVTALLSTTAAVARKEIYPSNPNTVITIRPSPERKDINQSFWFELPTDWTDRASLDLHVKVNPYRDPTETNYLDNEYDLPGGATFNPSPSLTVDFFDLTYAITTTSYSPRYTEDILHTYSWILRAYPLGGAVGEYFKPTLLHLDGGTTLGHYVNRTDADCFRVYSSPGSDVSLCASYYANQWLNILRIAPSLFSIFNLHPNPKAFFYGMISDASKNFPRGQAMYALTSVGPAGTPGSPFSLGSGWDTDGTYADWYAAHEIGHSLGRMHPVAGSDDPATAAVENCGHSRDDSGFPYGDTSHSTAPIGDASGATEGFDRGDKSLNIKPAVLPSNIWNDVMSYCSNQWLSDYNYKAMYDYMIAHPSLPQSLGDNRPMVGDFLYVAGQVNPGAQTASITTVSRQPELVNIKDPDPTGAYRLRQVDANGGLLSEVRFATQAVVDGPNQAFGEALTYAPGVDSVQVLPLDKDIVLASYHISPTPPQVGNVSLPFALQPVSGKATLAWSAQDKDGDRLTFDIAYSPDGGASFLPVAMGYRGQSLDIDTDQLPGAKSGVFRVIASDGANTALADSKPYALAGKPPQPFILSPGAGTHLHYGQQVNVSGFAQDAQDGLLDPARLAWKDGAGQALGAGASLTLYDLPVGVNTLTLQATNSLSLTATTSITISVDDDLSLPGPTLEAAPQQVGWQVPVESSTVVTATLTVNNSGGGSLDWTASSDQPWLGLSASGGTLSADGSPAALTLSASPAGMAPGVHTAHVTLSPAGGGANVVVTVSLVVGAAPSPPAGKFAGFTLFMPVMNR